MRKKKHTECACDHDHHGHDHNHGVGLSLPQRWLLSLVIIGGLLVVLRPFVISQLLVRVTSYAANGSYADASRICKKIITLDKDNVRGWTALGYAYKEQGDTKDAVEAFQKVLSINPADKGSASFELGQAYYAQGDYARAIGYFERVRSAGPRASALLEADVLKYRHGTLGLRSLNSMETLLKDLMESYKKVGNSAQALEVEKEYEAYKSKHSKVLF